jgi:hypothetical protein
VMNDRERAWVTVAAGFRARFKTPIMAWMMIGMEA